MRPRTDPFEAKDQKHRCKCSKKKKGIQNFFQAISKNRSSKIFFRQKSSSKIFFQAVSIWGNQKKIVADFPQGFWRFQRNFNSSKIVLFSSREQGNFRGLEASRPRLRTSKCVLDDSTSVCKLKSFWYQKIRGFWGEGIIPMLPLNNFSDFFGKNGTFCRGGHK